jgi:hypothetical protein
VDDAGRALEARRDGGAIRDARAQRADGAVRGLEQGEVSLLVGGGGRALGEVVDDDDLIAARAERMDDVRADEAHAARDDPARCLCGHGQPFAGICTPIPW